MKRKKYWMMFSIIGYVLLITSCGIKENTATGGKGETTIITDSAIRGNETVSDSAINGNEEKKDMVPNSAIVENGEKDGVVSNDTLEEKNTSPNTVEEIPADYADKGDTKVEFTIHNQNSYCVMGVTLPKGWDYSFIGSAHEDLIKDAKCCCVLQQTETVRTTCTCSENIGVKEEAEKICENAFKGKGQQSSDKKLTEYGICLWKKENPKMKISYLYHKNKLLFCGTGVTIEKEKLENNGTPLKATSLMEQMEETIWYTLILDRTKLIVGKEGDYAVECTVEKKLWNQYQSEIQEILEGITIKPYRQK